MTHSFCFGGSFQLKLIMMREYLCAEQFDESGGLAECNILNLVVLQELAHVIPTHFEAVIRLNTHPRRQLLLSIWLQVMQITFFVVAAILIPHLANSILFVMKSPQQSKCFYTQHSPDKTLEARLGFLRKERLRCSAIFSVGIIDSEGNMKEKIYSSQHRCEQTKTNEPYVLKHTSENFEYQGLYKVCVEMQFNENENTVVEIFLGEKLNPIIFEHSEQALPLVESADLLNLDLTAQSIKRSLVKSRNFHQQTREKGQKLDLRITEMQSVYTFSSLMQIVCLICFGMAWVAILQKFKRTK